MYPPPPPPQQMPPGYLEVKLSFFFLMWILYLVTPSVCINGMAMPRKWGTHMFPLAPGRYHVEAWYPYLFSSRTSPGSIVVDIFPGQVTAVSYRPAGLVPPARSCSGDPIGRGSGRHATPASHSRRNRAVRAQAARGHGP